MMPVFSSSHESRQVMDIVSFKQDPNYVGFDSCVEFRPPGTPEDEPAPLLRGLDDGNDYVNDLVLDLYQEARVR